jgi:hypothetical protein
MVKPISLIHDTEDGMVHLWASEAKEGGWNARFWGEALAGAAHFGTVEEANAHLARCFAEMFPAHVCTEACGTPGAVAARNAADARGLFHGGLR